MRLPLTLWLLALDAPKELTATEVKETMLTLQWKRPLAKLDFFRVVYVSADGHKAEEEVAGSSDSLTLRGLTPGMLYTISITAERGSKSSSPATIVAATGRRRKDTARIANVTEDQGKMSSGDHVVLSQSWTPKSIFTWLAEMRTRKTRSKT